MSSVAAVTISPARRVSGRLDVPGDKSIAHRYALIAALADGPSRLTNFAPGADCHSTLGCLAALGVDIRAGNGFVIYYGPALDGPVDLADAPAWTLLEKAFTDQERVMGTIFGRVKGGFTVDLSGAEIELISVDDREHRLKNLLAQVREEFDFIIIDSPPSLGLLTINALVAADGVIVPVQCEYFALEGLADLVGTMRRVRGSLNPRLDIEGVLLTMYDDRTNLGQQVARDVRDFFKEKVFNTIIPRNVRLAEAPSHGIPAVLYDERSRGAAAYVALAKEMLARRAA